MLAESELVKQSQKGDATAFMQLIERHDHRIMSVVHRFTFDQFDRDDIYQEVFLAAFKNVRRFRGDCAFATWLLRIALNRCIDLERKRKKERWLELPSQAIDPQQSQKLASVYRALRHLAKGPRTCFQLHYLEGMTVEEIADLLSCRSGTVKSQLNRARKQIRQHDEVQQWIQATA